MSLTGFSRRSLLRGAGGACLALPLLEFTTGAAPRRFAARGAREFVAPRRLVIVYTPNGNVVEQWRPSGTEQKFTLPRILKPLAPHQQDIVVLDGVDALSAFNGPGDAHQKGTGQCLTCTELQDGDFPGADGNSAGWANGISIDQRIADEIGEQTKFRSLEFGVHVYGANVGSRISYRGPAQPIPPENDPAAAFDRMFGDFEADPAKKARRIAERRSVLDAVIADYTRLMPRLGAADRAKLDAHLSAIRDFESRLDADADAAAACAPPQLGKVSDPSKVANIPKTGKLQMDLMTMALACDLTRVMSLMWTNSATAKPFPWLDISEGHHELAHRGDDDADAQEKLTRINTWYSEQFAYLLASLKAIPEGDGTLLDNTLVVWINEHAKGNDHARHEMPYILAGRAGGAVRTGRWLRVDGDVPHSNMWVGVMNAMGIEATSFGNPIYCTGALDLG